MVLICGGNSYAQNVMGRVTDAQSKPLSNVTISIPALERICFTNSEGVYQFDHLEPGIYVIQCSLIGYAKAVSSVTVQTNDVTQDFQLRISPLEMPPVIVTAQPQPADILSLSQPVAASDGRQLDRNRGQSIIQSIEDLPGLAMASRGPTLIRPVIRGLTSQRVVVAENGVRHQDQQWHDEESPGISTLDVDRIEVERGPNSVMFGADALGGVVNVIKAGPKYADENTPQLAGELLMNGFSSNSDEAAELTLYGANGDLGYRAALGGRNSGDIATPSGVLGNSGGNEFNGRGSLGLKKEWGNVVWDFSHYDQKTELHPDPEGPLNDISPFQKVKDERANARLNYLAKSFRFEFNGNWQRNETQIYQLDTADLILNSFTFDARLHHKPIGHLNGTVGASFLGQSNESGVGAAEIIPGFESSNFGGFLYEQMELNAVSFSGGVRIDARSFKTENEAAKGGQPDTDFAFTVGSNNYTAVSGALGAVWHVAKPVGIALNVGRGWRAPTVQELFVNGGDADAIPPRNIEGDPDLSPEASFNVDFSVRCVTSRLTGEAAIFRNRISKYIYLSPKGTKDPDTGFDDYGYKQADATLTGGEVRVQAQALKWLVVNVGGDMVRAQNDETDTPLPLTPPYRFLAGLRLISQKLGFLENPYFAARSMVTADQKRVAVDETPTGGYTLFGLEVGGEIHSSSQVVRLDLSVENLFDRAYTDHLSRYKDYALSAGRNVSLKIGVPFGLIRHE
jgi:iron complex outermembrane receptor protein